MALPVDLYGLAMLSKLVVASFERHRPKLDFSNAFVAIVEELIPSLKQGIVISISPLL